MRSGHGSHRSDHRAFVTWPQPRQISGRGLVLEAGHLRRLHRSGRRRHTSLSSARHCQTRP